MPENTSVHNYTSIVAGVIIAALISAVVSMSHRIDVNHESMLHRDYLEERLGNIEIRLEKLEQINEK
jgi:hypothetical protein